MKKMIKIIFVLCFSVVLLSYGFMMGQYHYFPYNQIREVKRNLTGNSETSTYSNYYYNKESFYSAYNNGKPDLVFLGDSLTDIAEWQEMFPNLLVVNRGINGDTTIGVIDRLSSITSMQPTKIFIMLGVNDIMTGKTVEDTYNNYIEIIKTLKSKGFDIYVQSTLLADHFKADNSKIIELNSKLVNFCKENNITYIDLNSGLTINEKLRGDLTIDGIHLNNKGYDIWKSEINKILNNK
ncbi:GDSL-type esterase/lipase family protein [Providencia hangzhouensis]|uniref:GDSL-type esterase/lipase family protein n=1 Tax=Providencia hangzhouensis TaxID=3031799 RepID=UPI003F4B2FE5